VAAFERPTDEPAGQHSSPSSRHDTASTDPIERRDGQGARRAFADIHHEFRQRSSALPTFVAVGEQAGTECDEMMAPNMAHGPTLGILGYHPGVPAEVRYFNRELSWLQFNERVLALAADPDVELLERARFLALFQTGLDEFFQVRVAGLREQVDADVTGFNPDGMSPSEQLDAIDDIVTQLSVSHARIFSDDVVHQLKHAGNNAQR
jgi:hypothetical protein